MPCCWSGGNVVGDAVEDLLVGPSLKVLTFIQGKLDAGHLEHDDLDELLGVLQGLADRWDRHKPQDFRHGLLPLNDKGDQVSPDDRKEGLRASQLQDGRDEGGKWQNWSASTPRIKLQFRSTPSLAEELPVIIADAKAQQRRIRCVGHAHSWTPVFADTEASQMVYVKKLQLDTGKRYEVVRRADIASGKPALIRVAAGVTTGELAQWMDGDAAADIGHTGLPTDAILNTVRYGGVISMACHGTGREVRDIGDSIHSLTLVDAQGTTRVYNAESPHWNEVRGSFGLMGIIQDITFELDGSLDKPYVNNDQNFDEKMERYFKAQDAEHCQRLKELVLSNWATELFWFPLNSVPPALLAEGPKLRKYLSESWNPYDDTMWLNLMTERVAAPANGAANDIKHFVDQATPLQDLETRLGGLTNAVSQDLNNLWLQTLSGILGTKILRLENKVGYLQDGVRSLPAAIHYQKAIDNFPVNDFEMCFKVAPDFSNVVEAWRAVVDIAAAEIRGGSNPLNVAMECRFTKGSFLTMSPAYMGPADDGALYCWLEVLSGRRTKAWEAFVRKVFDAWVKIDATGPPKPHWAKWNAPADAKTPDFVKEYAKRVYAEQIQVFKRAVQAADPGGLFRNDWLADLLAL
ncbi:hypothetical protein WJX72_001001 [[Myrmecia] bisecta]|uniref:FAD-binding PCMH-type domain-containing protein n=1 Tax=[Myrmecia] bisecta TaxID=41462 RepID=A0AAW1PGI4_9CHLO